MHGLLGGSNSITAASREVSEKADFLSWFLQKLHHSAHFLMTIQDAKNTVPQSHIRFSLTPVHSVVFSIQADLERE